MDNRGSHQSGIKEQCECLYVSKICVVLAKSGSPLSTHEEMRHLWQGRAGLTVPEILLASLTSAQIVLVIPFVLPSTLFVFGHLCFNY